MKRPAILLSALFCVAMQPAFALDTDKYKQLVAETYDLIDSGSPDTGELVRLQEELIAMSLVSARTFAAQNPQHAGPVNFAIDNLDAMMRLDPDEIEEAWHEGTAYEAASIDPESIPEEGQFLVSAMVHPATAIVVIRAYETTQDEEYLATAQDELGEIIDMIDG